ncbi:MAG TPA: hypothetical protein DEU95_03305, partial [Chloroflexi bacterium]|nr:hypothetical protein [Chloroflexota bacterium]
MKHVQMGELDVWLALHPVDCRAEVTRLVLDIRHPSVFGDPDRLGPIAAGDHQVAQIADAPIADLLRLDARAGNEVPVVWMDRDGVPRLIPVAIPGLAQV